MFRSKVENYFEKWYTESKQLALEDKKDPDSLSHFGYEIYESLMSDSVLLKNLYVDKQYEYVLVPDKIKVTSLSSAGLDSCYKSFYFDETKDSEYTTIDLTEFRPKIENRKCLYFTPKYQKHFYRFSARYGVKPYILVDSPLMFGGDRFLETSPFVSEIKIYRNTSIVSIVYSLHTSDFESFFKYENNKLIFIKHRYEIAVD